MSQSQEREREGKRGKEKSGRKDICASHTHPISSHLSAWARVASERARAHPAVDGGETAFFLAFLDVIISFGKDE